MSSTLSLFHFSQFNNIFDEHLEMQRRMLRFNPLSMATIPMGGTTENDTDYTVKVELAGIETDNILVTVEGRTLTVSSKQSTTN